jgi:branched-chain amino acid transport system substrate-binding protein
MKLFFWLPLTFILSFLVSCSTTPKKNPPKVASYDAKKELSQAQIELAAGNEKKATSRLRNLIAKHPKSDVADDASLALAQIYFKQNNFEQAYKVYIGMVESDVLSPNEAEALLGASRSLHRLGRMEEALALNSRGLKIAGLSENQKLEFYRQRYGLQSMLGDRLDSLRSLAFVFEKDPKTENRTSAQARAYELVNMSLNESDLEKVVSDSAFGFVRGPAAFRLALAKLKAKDFSEARTLFANASAWSPGTPVQKQADNYLVQIDSRRKVEPFTIGAELPLTGKYAPIAQKTLRGLQLGLGIYGPDRSEFKLAVVDSEGTPDGARKSVERLVTEDNVIAIVGSLLSRTAPTVVSKTEELGIPSITLSQKSGLTESGTYVFRNAVTSEMQVKELVRQAMDQLGMRRFALLYPNEPYGVEYANLFWDEVLAKGGMITAAQSYSPQETDFRGPIRRLVGTYYLDDRRVEYQNRVRAWFKKQKKLTTRQSPPDDLLPPVVDFDAIFIPDGPKAVGQIGPMLAYQGVQRVRLLGTNVWNTGETVRRGQRTVENALFVDTSLTTDANFKTSKFYADFTKTFGEEPGLFEAQGYEAGMILRHLISQGERSRVGLAQALAQLREFQGVSGPMSMNNQREIVRPLTIYIVKNNEILAWTPALEGSNLSEPTGATGKKTLRK